MLASPPRVHTGPSAWDLAGFRLSPRVSLPRDSSATLALLVSRGLLSAEKDEHATGRPLVYRATPGLLQLLGAETLEEVRGG